MYTFQESSLKKGFITFLLSLSDALLVVRTNVSRFTSRMVVALTCLLLFVTS